MTSDDNGRAIIANLPDGGVPFATRNQLPARRAPMNQDIFSK